jgi:hypothetical protein
MLHSKESKHDQVQQHKAAAGKNGVSLMPPQSNVNVSLQRKAETGLPEQVQTKMESAFNTSFSDVKIHTNSSKASDIGAQAFTQGNNVHFAQAKFNPSSQSGQELIGHELSHVVQQREGRVKPTTQMKGVAINNDSSLEREADVQGTKAARGEAVQRKTNNIQSSPTHIAQAKPVQMMKGVLNFGKTMFKNFSKNSFPMVDAEFARRDGKSTIKEISNSFSEGNYLKGLGTIIYNLAPTPKVPFVSKKYGDDMGSIMRNTLENGIQGMNNTKSSYSGSNKSMDFTSGGSIIDKEKGKKTKNFDSKIYQFPKIKPTPSTLQMLISYYQANKDKMSDEQAAMLYKMIIQAYFALVQQSMHSEDDEDEYSDYRYLNDENIKE